MTNLESTVINALYDICEMDQCGFGQLSEETGLSTSVLRGVVTSLAKKGIAKVIDNSACQIIIVEDTEWPCDFFSEEEWAKKKANALMAA
jgi:hypothetical protein